jgi:hypothetical protein
MLISIVLETAGNVTVLTAGAARNAHCLERALATLIHKLPGETSCPKNEKVTGKKRKKLS